MIDLDLTDLFVTSMTIYGPSVLGVVLMLGALGMPVPGTLLLLTAGALAREGSIDWSAALGLGLLGTTVGDSTSYTMGRFAKGWVQRRFGQSLAWQKAQHNFEQRGPLAVYSTRFLLTPLAIPTNLIAGGCEYDFRRFFTYDVAGEVTWILFYGGLGYAFGSQWEVVTQVVSDYSSWLGSMAIMSVGAYFLICRYRQQY